MTPNRARRRRTQARRGRAEAEYAAAHRRMSTPGMQLHYAKVDVLHAGMDRVPGFRRGAVSLSGVAFVVCMAVWLLGFL